VSVFACGAYGGDDWSDGEIPSHASGSLTTSTCPQKDRPNFWRESFLKLFVSVHTRPKEEALACRGVYFAARDHAECGEVARFAGGQEGADFGVGVGFLHETDDGPMWQWL